MTKRYKTVSTDSLHVMAGVLPLDLRVGMDRDYVAFVSWHQGIDETGLTPDIVDLWRPSFRREDLRRIHHGP